MISNHNQISGYSPFLARLRDLFKKDATFVGCKAANLGELIRNGFPVPDGFVLTTAAFNRFMEANRLPSDSTPEAIMKGTMPTNLANSIKMIADELGGTSLAVRSSGIAEDLVGASYAGQYETILNVVGYEQLLAAVRRCWASIFNKRVIAYQKHLGRNEFAGMALLIQHMVPADAAGVAFTANPVTNDRNETVISAVRGIGERLVSGEISPDEWFIKDDKVTCQNAKENAISAEQAKAIAAMARRIEAHFGVPQDIEWAMVNGHLFLLQSRPITTLTIE